MAGSAENGPGFRHRNPISRACSKTQTFVLPAVATWLHLPHRVRSDGLDTTQIAQVHIGGLTTTTTLVGDIWTGQVRLASSHSVIARMNH